MSEAGETKKPKSQPPPKIEALMTEGRWADVRKRLKRIESPKRVGELLYHGVDDPNVPDDIFETLLSKLNKENREHRYARSKEPHREIVHSFWLGVCNYKRQSYSKCFNKICNVRSVSSLRLFLKEYMQVVGCFWQETARVTISYLWSRYLVGVSRCYFVEEKEEALLSVTSLEELRSNANLQELHILWQKTELIISMTKAGGLDKSAKQLNLVRSLILACAPKVVSWLAIRLYPAQLKVKDRDGRLPLHWAAILNNRDTEKDIRGDCEFKGELGTMVNERRIVELVLDAFPKGAKYVDVWGSHPLALLLHGEYISWTLNGWTQRCVTALVKQAPEALVKKNAKNWMLPFMAGAAIHEENTVVAHYKSAEWNMLNRKLNLAYWLLRENPSVVASGRTETPRERFLRIELEAAQSQIERLKADASARPMKQARLQEKLIPGTAIIDGSVMREGIRPNDTTSSRR